MPKSPSESAHTLSPVEYDELAIRKLSEAWFDANNRRDAAAFQKFWTPDAIWSAGEPFAWSGQGVDAILQLYHQLCDKFVFFFTMGHSPVFEVTGDTAYALWHMCEVAQGNDPNEGMVNYGLYEDELVRTNHRGKFRKRHFHFLYLDKSPLPGKWMPIPQILFPKHDEIHSSLYAKKLVGEY